jgi:hypothetical protein
MKKIDVYTLGAREKFEAWIKDRGGVKVWRNINLSNPGAGPIFTPAYEETQVDMDSFGANMRAPYPKPSWRVDNGEVITDITRFRFAKGFKEFKRIRVALERGSGYNYRLTDGSQRKVDRAMQACMDEHGDAVYRKDGGLFDAERFIVVEIPEWEDA